MTKKLWLALSFTLIGCGSNEDLTSSDIPAKTHTFQFENQNWQITTPGDWQILPAERQVPFVAQKGSQNVAILERDLTNSDPVEQIINSAQNQFFAFTLDERSGSAWKFTGQPGPTNPPRTFWQEIKTIPTARKFLIASCSELAESADGSPCGAILDSWGLVMVEV